MNKSEMLTCRLPSDVLKQIQDCADARSLSVSEYLRGLIKRPLNRHRAQDARTKRRAEINNY